MNKCLIFLAGLVLLPAVGQCAAPGHAGMTRQEFLDYHARIFDRWDADHDGVLSAQERAGLRDAEEAARLPPRPKRPLLHPSK